MTNSIGTSPGSRESASPRRGSKGRECAARARRPPRSARVELRRHELAAAKQPRRPGPGGRRCGPPPFSADPPATARIAAGAGGSIGTSTFVLRGAVADAHPRRRGEEIPAPKSSSSGSSPSAPREQEPDHRRAADEEPPRVPTGRPQTAAARRELPRAGDLALDALRRLGLLRVQEKDGTSPAARQGPSPERHGRRGVELAAVQHRGEPARVDRPEHLTALAEQPLAALEAGIVEEERLVCAGRHRVRSRRGVGVRPRDTWRSRGGRGELSTRWKGASTLCGVAYEGGRFRGFQRQPGLPTVQDALEGALLAAGVRARSPWRREPTRGSTRSIRW